MPRRHRHNPLQKLQPHLPKLLAALAGAAVLAGGAYIALRQSPEDHFQAGSALFQQGDIKGAAIELKNSLQADPNNAAARFLLGRVHFVNGDFAAAEKELRMARDLGSKEADLEPLLARTLLQINQPQRILDEIRAREEYPAEVNAAILALRARAHLLLKESVAADTELGKARDISPDHPEVLVSLAYAALSDQNLQSALELVDQAVAKADARADLWIMKGDLLRAATRNPEAAQAYAKALALDPANGPARLASAQLHLENNDLDKAEADLKQLLKHAPNSLFGRHLDAFIDFRRGRHPEANAKLQDILRAAPTFLPAQLLAGATSLALGNREAAKSHLNKVLEAAPDHALARKLMAATLTELGEVDQAKQLLSGFEAAGNDPLLNTLRGELALRQGDYAQARKQLEAMGEAAPQTSKYFTDLAASRMGSGDEAGAIAALTKAAELDTTSARPDALLVMTHVREKRFAEADKVVDRLEKERADDPLVHNLRGTIHIARDDKKQARASLAMALQIKPDYFPAASNLALLDMTDKDHKAARSRFEQLLKHAPAESRAWLALAALDARENNEAGYLKNLEQAKKANSKNPQAHALLTRYWLGKQDGGKALAAARDGLTATGLPEFHELVGLAQIQQKDPLSAQSTFSRWAELSPANPLAHFRLAQAQITNKEREAALKSLDKALSLRADFTEAVMSKALLLVEAGRSAEALKLARGLQAGAPKNAAGYLVEAEVHLADKKFAEAAKLFAKSAELSGQGQALGRAYQAYARANQAAEGERLLTQWLNNKPKDAMVRHILASVQLSGKQLKEAAQNYRLLVGANPKDVIALNNLAWVLGELKDPQALAYAEQALKLAPKDGGVLDTYGWQLVLAGQAKKALPYLREAVKAQPNNPEIRWHLAVALENSGDKAAALEELDRLLTSRMEFPQKAQAQALFDRLKGR